MQLAEVGKGKMKKGEEKEKPVWTKKSIYGKIFGPISFVII